MNAGQLAEAGGTGARILNDGFQDFAERRDLPDFDIIGLHGIWSWVSHENRRILLRIIGERLAPGGVVYISYNSTPGWSPAMPLQHLMSLYGQAHAGQDLKARVEGAVAFVQRFADSNARYFALNPQLAERLKDIRGKDWRYLAHEYFNADWHPSPFSEVHADMASVRCDFAASAHIMDLVDAANMTPAGRQLLADMKGTVLRETTRDVLVNQQFRRDVYVKGARVLHPVERNRATADMRVMLIVRPEDIKLETTTALGKIQLRPDLYQPVIDALASRRWQPVSVGELSRDKGVAALPLEILVEVLTTLIGIGALATAQEPSDGARSRCASLNDAIRERSPLQDDLKVLASPVTGTGIFVNRVNQLFQAAVRAGRRTDGEILDAACDMLAKTDPFRPAPRDAAKETKLRSDLATDLKTYRTLAPMYEALGLV